MFTFITAKKATRSRYFHLFASFGSAQLTSFFYAFLFLCLSFLSLFVVTTTRVAMTAHKNFIFDLKFNREKEKQKTTEIVMTTVEIKMYKKKEDEKKAKHANGRN